MADAINEDIIEQLKNKSKDDKQVKDFLVDMLYKEAENPPGWWFRDTYKSKIEEYVKDWGDDE